MWWGSQSLVDYLFSQYDEWDAVAIAGRFAVPLADCATHILVYARWDVDPHNGRDSKNDTKHLYIPFLGLISIAYPRILMPSISGGVMYIMPKNVDNSRCAMIYDAAMMRGNFVKVTCATIARVQCMDIIQFQEFW